ncbi:beta-lactamase/transpeptidase-like protein [Aspergillus keveii]|uniref:Beta-lactamase/transpeptidase-like protein n=1 Tax=Aspergillus keveii TaxID=714993 RepID=A0ABR4G7D0_9EURO
MGALCSCLGGDKEETQINGSTTPRKITQSPLDEEFAKIVQSTLEQWHIEGISIAVIDGDNTFSEGYGLAALPDIPVKPDTLFWTGSTTKSFTAAAASLLVDDTENYPDITWTTPLSDLIRDDFVLQDEYATRHITLEDALSHRTGLPGHMLTLGREGTVRDVVRSLRHLPMDKEIRSAWQYCNAMFITVSHAIEVTTGEWLGDFLRKRIWEPLGMDSTFFSLDDARKYAASGDTVLAQPYAWDEATQQSREVPHCEGTLSGAGAVISNVLDYAKYIRALIRQTAPLSKAGHAALLKPRSFPPQMIPHLNKQTLYTLGLMTSTYRGETVVFHPGGLDGMTATMIYFPERDWGVAVFANAAGPGRESLAWHLIDEMLQVPQNERIDLYNVVREKRAKVKEYLSKSRERLYPGVATQGRPLSLPLAEYTGTFTHPAYPDLIITLPCEDELILNAKITGSFHGRLVLKHVTADYFLAELYETFWAVDPAMVIKAEFHVNVEGKVDRFGAAVDYADMPDTLIWFDKAA